MLRTWCALEQGGVCEVMFEVMLGDAAEQLKSIEDCTINCCVTSPPYYCLRDYGMDGQIGLEESPAQALFLLPLKNLKAQTSKFAQSLVSH